MLSGEQFEKAAEAFRTAVTKDPLLAMGYYGEGQAYMGLRRFASAAKSYEECIEAYRTLASMAQGNQVAVDRQRDQEIRELKESAQMVQSGTIKTSGDAQNMILRLESRIRDLEQQKQRGFEAFQPPAEVLLALGSAQFRNGNAAEAQRRWEEAVKANAKLGEAWNNLAVIYMQAGRKADAQAAIKNAEKAGFRVNPRLKDDIARMP